MNVIFDTLGPFIKEIDDAIASDRPLFLNTVRYRIHERFLQKEKVVAEYGFVATALVHGGDDGDGAYYLIEFAEELGVFKSGDDAVKLIIQDYVSRLMSLCQSRQLLLREGKWEA